MKFYTQMMEIKIYILLRGGNAFLERVSGGECVNIFYFVTFVQTIQSMNVIDYQY